MASNPQFEGTPVIWTGQLTGGLVQNIGQGATNGTRVDRVTFQAITQTTAGALRLYVNGTDFYEYATTGALRGTTTAAGVYVVGECHVIQLIMVLPSGSWLQAQNINANEIWNYVGEGGNF
jgi:hypothetical protein